MDELPHWMNPDTGKSLIDRECIEYYIPMMEKLCTHKEGECPTVKLFREELENPSVPILYLALKAHEFMVQLATLYNHRVSIAQEYRANTAWMN